MTTPLSEHFSLEDATASSLAARLGIFNQPSSGTLSNMIMAAKELEKLQVLLGHPIQMLTWYLSPALNLANRDLVTSTHQHGWAVDIKCPEAGTPKEIADKILAADLRYDQLILEGDWLHLSFDPQHRFLKLTANKELSAPSTYSFGV